MALKISPVTPEMQKRTDNLKEMAKLIIIEMRKRGLQPSDMDGLHHYIDLEAHANIKEIWNPETEQGE